MNHVVLLGDSIFDNASYVPGGPSVVDHLGRSLPHGWQASLLAVDGSVAADVVRQLDKLPASATHLVVSAGGNNALGQAALVRSGATASFTEVLARLAHIRAEFQAEYRDMLRHVLAARRATVVCTVYDAIPGLGKAEHTGLCLFNEAISAEAARAGVPVVDLRLICDEASDYAPSSPIEPSAAGGGKIARAVVRAVTGHDFAAGGCRVYT